jgi:hypothetical protein
MSCPNLFVQINCARIARSQTQFMNKYEDENGLVSFVETQFMIQYLKVRCAVVCPRHLMYVPCSGTLTHPTLPFMQITLQYSAQPRQAASINQAL